MPYGGKIHGAVGADIVQADVDAIVQGLAGSPGRTLADVHERLDHGLCDPDGHNPYLRTLQTDMDRYLFNPLASMPWLATISDDLYYYLGNPQWGHEPWLQTVDRSINDGFFYHLFDQNNYQPWMQTVHNDLWNPVSPMSWLETIASDLRYYLCNQWNNQTWMETLYSAIDGGFYYMLYDQNGMQPLLRTLNNTIESNLRDWMNDRPWMESIRDELSALRAVLEDVYDAAQHALRTV